MESPILIRCSSVFLLYLPLGDAYMTSTSCGGRLSTKCRSTVKEPSNEGSGEALQTSFVYRPWKITSDVRSLLEWYSCGMGWDAAGKEGRRRISPRSSGRKIYGLSVRLPVTKGGRIVVVDRADADGGSQATNARYFTCLLRLLS